MIRFLLCLLTLAAYVWPACTKMNMPTDYAIVTNGTRANLKANFTETQTRANACMDSTDEVRGRLSGYTGSFAVSSLENLRLRLDADASTTAKLVVETSNGDSLFRVSEDSTARIFRHLTIDSNLTVGGISTFTGAPTYSSLTASLPVFTNGSKALTSNAMTGTGSVMMSASPTTTGTLTGAAANFGGAVSVSSDLTVGDATATDRFINIKAPAGSYRALSFNTGSLPRWVLRVANGSESGSDANANLEMLAYSDAGSPIGSPVISITRATGGTMTITRPVSMSSTMGVTGLLTASGSVSVPDLNGMITTISASNRGLIARSGTTLNVGENGGWTDARYNIASGTHGFNVGGSTYLSLATTGATVTGGLTLSGTASAADAKLFIDAASGMSIRGKTGSSYDFSLYTPAGSVFLRNPTGTSTIEFPGASTHTGVATFAAAPVFSAATASTAAEFDGSKNLVSVTKTGTGNDVYSASPTLTGTIAGANQTLSGTLGVTGVATFTAAPVFSSVTASQILSVDGSKGLTSTATTGTGSVMLAASPTTTGTLTAAAITASGNVTADSLISSKFYAEGTYTATLTGCTTSPTVTARYVRVGKLVTILLPPVSATSNSNAMTITGLPAGLIPTRYLMAQFSGGLLIDNGNFLGGSTIPIMRIRSDTGAMEFGTATAASSAWGFGTFTTSGTKGLFSYSGGEPFVITYTLQ